MNKNLLKITTILCSVSFVWAGIVYAREKGDHKPSGSNVTVTQQATEEGVPTTYQVTGPNGNAVNVSKGSQGENNTTIDVWNPNTSSSSNDQISINKGEDATSNRYIEKTDRNTEKEVYNNGDGTYTYDSFKGKGEETDDDFSNGTVKSITVGNGSASKYKTDNKTASDGTRYSRTVDSSATKGEGVTRTAETGDETDQTGITVQGSNGTTTVDIYQNGTEVASGTATATKNGDGTASITTSGGKTKTVTKPSNSTD